MLDWDGSTTGKSLFDTFDFSRVPSLDVSFQNLRDCRFIESGVNVVIVGDEGTGKTHLSGAIAQQARRKGSTVAWLEPEPTWAMLVPPDPACSGFDDLLLTDLVVFDSLELLNESNSGWFVRLFAHRFDLGKSSILVSSKDVEQWCTGVDQNILLGRMRHSSRVRSFRLAPRYRR
jgi:chromosomal replication initiation ATPase DnaA